MSALEEKPLVAPERPRAESASLWRMLLRDRVAAGAAVVLALITLTAVVGP